MDGRSSRRRFLRAGAAGATLLAGCSSPSGSPGFFEGFEGDGLDPWETGADVPDDPNRQGPVEWSIERSTERAASGGASARLSLDGRQDDGTIWLVRPVSVRPGRAYDVRTWARAWSPSESFNTIAHLVMYAGPERPTAEESFPPPGANSSDAGVVEAGGLRQALNRQDGWLTYSFAWATPRLGGGTLYVAVGISAVWETEMTYFVDDVELAVERR